MAAISPGYLVGSLVRLTVHIADIATNLPVNPGILLLKVRPPADALYTLTYGVDAEVKKDADGIYYIDLELTKAGRWRWRWESSTPNVGAIEDELIVQPSRVI